VGSTPTARTSFSRCFLRRRIDTDLRRVRLSDRRHAALLEQLHRHAEKFLHATGAKIAHGRTRAYYSLSTDAVPMPLFESFRDADSYYSTLAHELPHWTSAKNRLDRDFGGHRFGSNAYAQQELPAELGAAFPCADLELELEPREDHAAYVANWLEVLQNDSRAIFTGAARAQKAADFIHKFSACSAEKVRCTTRK
jgi:antirestriction protein ArdC